MCLSAGDEHGSRSGGRADEALPAAAQEQESEGGTGGDGAPARRHRGRRHVSQWQNKL